MDTWDRKGYENRTGPTVQKTELVQILDTYSTRTLIFDCCVISCHLIKFFQKLAIVEEAKSSKLSPTKLKGKGVLDLTMQVCTVSVRNLDLSVLWMLKNSVFNWTPKLSENWMLVYSTKTSVASSFWTLKASGFQTLVHLVSNGDNRYRTTSPKSELVLITDIYCICHVKINCVK